MENIDSFRDARKTLENVIKPTPLIHSQFFSNMYNNNIYLKPENMQLTGSYKIRGAYYKISKLTTEEKKHGLITSSAGNHAQGVALAASLLNIKATIIMPTTTPLVKVNATRAYGAKVILFGDVFDESYKHAINLSIKHKYTFIQPFNDLQIATGQGTIAFEIIKDLPDVDVILVPIGGGGLISGVSTLIKKLHPSVKIIGVEPTGAASMSLALEKGEVTTLDKVVTIADGVAVKTVGDKVFPYVQKNVDEIITIDDNELIDAFLLMIEKHKMIVENAGLLTVAALKKLNCTNLNVVSILSGGNMDVITMSSLIQHGLINRGRIFTFSIKLPDKPGELTKVTKLIADKNGNIVKLKHNQFININRISEVEIEVTCEAYGIEHKDLILEAFVSAGYETQLVSTKSD